MKAIQILLLFRDIIDMIRYMPIICYRIHGTPYQVENYRRPCCDRDLLRYKLDGATHGLTSIDKRGKEIQVVVRVDIL